MASKDDMEDIDLESLESVVAPVSQAVHIMVAVGSVLIVVAIAAAC